MKHHDRNRKLGRNTNQRRALLKSLACSLIRDEKIKTTEAKAKELRKFIEKLVTKASKNDQATYRFIYSKIGNKTQTEKLIKDVAPKYIERNGGYTRIIKLPIRKSDASKMAQIEFV
ncbi:50S ribosomal protein L17 [Candidatus Parcubacteria bacterium]|nr:50S ribosomal protein L17 [Candidatus Parcubacteria bacterium]